VLHKAHWPLWPAALAEEIETPVSHWSAARASVRAPLWPAAPHWLARYSLELLTAHAHSLTRKPFGI
jgi:hypothetical protein